MATENKNYGGWAESGKTNVETREQQEMTTGAEQDVSLEDILKQVAEKEAAAKKDLGDAVVGGELDKAFDNIVEK